MRFRVLDSWRGIAALLVATYHFEVTWHWHEIALVRHSFLFVDFFFVLSGFVIAHAYGRKINSGEDLVSFIVRRFGRVWPLSALVLLAFVAVEALKLVLAKGFGISTGTAPFDPHGYTPLSALPTHFLLTTALNLQETLTWNGPDWSISAEFWTYLLIGVISLAATGWRTALVALSGLAAAIVLMAFSKRGMDVTYELGFVRCVYGFMIGQLVYETRRRLTQNSLPGLAFFEYVAIGLVIAFVWSVGRGPASFLAPLVFAVPVFVFSFEAGALSRGLLSRPAQALGDWSYSIYMVHAFVWFVIGMGLSVFQRHLGADFWQIRNVEGGTARTFVSDNFFALDLLFALYIGIVLLLASTTKRFIEDPGRRYFAGLADRLALSSRSSLTVIPANVAICQTQESR